MFFWAGGYLKSLFENLAFHRLLAKQTLQFFDLVPERAIFGSRDDILLSSSCRQRPLGGLRKVNNWFG